MVQNQRNVSCKEPLSVRLNLLQSQPPLNIFGLFLLSKFFHILVNYNFEVIFNFKELFYIRKTDEGKGMWILTLGVQLDKRTYRACISLAKDEK